MLRHGDEDEDRGHDVGHGEPEDQEVAASLAKLLLAAEAVHDRLRRGGGGEEAKFE